MKKKGMFRFILATVSAGNLNKTRKDTKHKRTPSMIVTAHCGTKGKAHCSAFNASSSKIENDQVLHQLKK